MFLVFFSARQELSQLTADDILESLDVEVANKVSKGVKRRLARIVAAETVDSD